jgi:hypothetical protein
MSNRVSGHCDSHRPTEAATKTRIPNLVQLTEVPPPPPPPPLRCLHGSNGARNVAGQMGLKNGQEWKWHFQVPIFKGISLTLAISLLLMPMRWLAALPAAARQAEFVNEAIGARMKMAISDFALVSNSVTSSPPAGQIRQLLLLLSAIFGKDRVKQNPSSEKGGRKE